MEIKLTIKNESELRPLVRRLAEQLAPGDVVFLEGDLGAGKTALARALVRTMTGHEDEEVPSPTFTLVQTYDTSKGMIWHFDLYRLKTSEEVVELGWDEARGSGIVLVEWPERLGPLKPRDRLEIKISIANGETREIDMIPHGKWKEKTW